MKFRVIEYPSLESTSDKLIQLARDGAAEGLVVKAGFQRRGRGQRNRRWYSPKDKGLLISILLKPCGQVNRMSYLTTMACQSVAETLRTYLESGVKLKLPNDVLVGSKKIAGVLVEGEVKGQRQEWACVGIGVNVMTSKRQIHKRGTSIFIEKQSKQDIYGVLFRLLHILSIKYLNQ